MKFSLILITSSKNSTQRVIPQHRCPTEHYEEDEHEDQDEPGSIEDRSYVHDPPWWVADLNGSFRPSSWIFVSVAYFSTDWLSEHPLGSSSGNPI